MTFAESAAAHRKVSVECGVCQFLADLPDGYRDEVLEALSGWSLTVTAIMTQVELDGYPSNVTRNTWQKHRRGDCALAVRRRLLGENDGVRGPSR